MTIAAQPSRRRACIVSGYPAPDVDLVRYALELRGADVTFSSQQWLAPNDYAGYQVVVIDGDLDRAGVSPASYAADELPTLGNWLEQGGVLLLMSGTAGILTATAEGRELLGMPRPAALPGKMQVLAPTHPWTAHLSSVAAAAPAPEADAPDEPELAFDDAETPVAGNPLDVPRTEPALPTPTPLDWLESTGNSPLATTTGVRLIGDADGQHALLAYWPVGGGRIVYVGWDLSRDLPAGREPSTLLQEETFASQYSVLDRLVDELCPPPAGHLIGFHGFGRPPYELGPTPAAAPSAASPACRSYPPWRPLPQAWQRPLPAGRCYVVHAQHGDDSAAGTLAAPWQSIAHAVKQLQPGDTLCLRQGIYREHVRLEGLDGAEAEPITIRGYPGELAVLDGSLAEFELHPETAWRPYPAGAAGEYESTNTYPQLADGRGGLVQGRFADSLTPLHGYRFAVDLRETNMFWNLVSNVGDDAGVYCGPGFWFNPETRRIHCRLAATTLIGLGPRNYRGETDPRKLPLLIAGRSQGPPLQLRYVRYLRFQDLVVRGTAAAAVEIAHCRDLEFDHVLMYGGSTCMSVRYSRGLRAVNCGFRGPAAPWTYRSSLKYRSIEASVFKGSGWLPDNNADFELAYCEFTDSVDGIYIGSIAGLRFHHNLVDNFSDDGVFMTAGTGYDGRTPGGPQYLWQNQFSRCLQVFAFGVGHGRQRLLADGRQTGAGAWVCRNLIDERPPVYYFQPKSADDEQSLTFCGRTGADHGGPAWEPMYLYHNTILAGTDAFRNYYLNGWGGHMADTTRRLFNNLYLQTAGMPGHVFAPPTADLQVSGNLHWAAAAAGDLGKRTKQLLTAAAIRQRPEGRPDQVADPLFQALPQDWRAAADLSLCPDSPAVDRGGNIPADWPDPLRQIDDEAPDIGLLPLAAEPFQIGIGGRFTVPVPSAP